MHAQTLAPAEPPPTLRADVRLSAGVDELVLAQAGLGGEAARAREADVGEGSLVMQLYVRLEAPRVVEALAACVAYVSGVYKSHMCTQVTQHTCHKRF